MAGSVSLLVLLLLLLLLLLLQALRPKLNDEQKQQLEECFELMDADGSGAIDADELGAAFKVRSALPDTRAAGAAAALGCFAALSLVLLLTQQRVARCWACS
jgi:hypothetical protein